jgi:hypothetical protein
MELIAVSMDPKFSSVNSNQSGASATIAIDTQYPGHSLGSALIKNKPTAPIKQPSVFSYLPVTDRTVQLDSFTEQVITAPPLQGIHPPFTLAHSVSAKCRCILTSFALDY